MKNVRANVNLFDGKNGVKGFATLELDIPDLEKIFVIKGMTIRDGSNGLFVSWPSHYSKKQDKYIDDVFPTCKADRDALNAIIMDAYENARKKQEVKAVSKFR